MTSYFAEKYIRGLKYLATLQKSIEGGVEITSYFAGQYIGVEVELTSYFAEKYRRGVAFTSYFAQQYRRGGG